MNEKHSDRIDSLLRHLQNPFAEEQNFKFGNHHREWALALEWLRDAYGDVRKELEKTRLVLFEVREADDAIINCEFTTKDVFDRVDAANEKADALLGRRVVEEVSFNDPS